MRVPLAAALAVAAIAAVAAAPSPAAPQRDLLIVPGQQIGKVRLGMSLFQVRRALGRPTGVNKRMRTGFASYVEYDWDYGRWTVGLSGRAPNLRVSLVATTIERERTREGIGVHALRARVLDAYRGRGLRCPPLDSYNANHYQRACRLVSRTGATTYFPMKYGCSNPRYGWTNCPTGRHAYAVFEVLIRTAAAAEPAYH
jgi:hypothetical protein